MNKCSIGDSIVDSCCLITCATIIEIRKHFAFWQHNDLHAGNVLMNTRIVPQGILNRIKLRRLSNVQIGERTVSVPWEISPLLHDFDYCTGYKRVNEKTDRDKVRKIIFTEEQEHWNDVVNIIGENMKISKKYEFETRRNRNFGQIPLFFSHLSIPGHDMLLLMKSTVVRFIETSPTPLPGVYAEIIDYLVSIITNIFPEEIKSKRELLEKKGQERLKEVYYVKNFHSSNSVSMENIFEQLDADLNKLCDDYNEVEHSSNKRKR